MTRNPVKSLTEPASILTSANIVGLKISTKYNLIINQSLIYIGFEMTRHLLL